MPRFQRRITSNQILFGNVANAFFGISASNKEFAGIVMVRTNSVDVDNRKRFFDAFAAVAREELVCSGGTYKLRVDVLDPRDNKQLCVVMHIFFTGIKLQLGRVDPRFTEHVCLATDPFFRALVKVMSRESIRGRHLAVLHLIQHFRPPLSEEEIRRRVAESPFYAFKYADLNFGPDVWRVMGQPIHTSNNGYVMLIGLSTDGPSMHQPQQEFEAFIHRMRADDSVRALVASPVCLRAQLLWVHMRNHGDEVRFRNEAIQNVYSDCHCTLKSMFRAHGPEDLRNAFLQITTIAGGMNTLHYEMFKHPGCMAESILRSAVHVVQDSRIAAEGRQVVPAAQAAPSRVPATYFISMGDPSSSAPPQGSWEPDRLPRVPHSFAAAAGQSARDWFASAPQATASQRPPGVLSPAPAAASQRPPSVLSVHSLVPVDFRGVPGLDEPDATEPVRRSSEIFQPTAAPACE